MGERQQSRGPRRESGRHQTLTVQVGDFGYEARVGDRRLNVFADGQVVQHTMPEWALNLVREVKYQHMVGGQVVAILNEARVSDEDAATTVGKLRALLGLKDH